VNVLPILCKRTPYLGAFVLSAGLIALSVWSATPARIANAQAPAAVLLSPRQPLLIHSGATLYVAVNIAVPAGAAQVEFRANDQVVSTTPVNGKADYNVVVAWTPSATGDFALQAVATDNAGQPVTSEPLVVAVREAAGSMIGIPAGKFLMGDNGGQPDERPQREVTLNAYLVDLFEVTVGEFRQFVIAKNWQTGAEKEGKPREQTWRLDDVPSRYDYPVRFVSWWDAEAYCTWAGKRLLTEAEWERAARGTDARRYPWGNDFDAARVSNNQGPAMSGWFGAGISPAGSYDMAGNVWEWVQDWYDPQFYGYPNVNDNPRGPERGDQKVLRGGSFTNPPDDLRTTRRIKNDAGSVHLDVGIRCGK